jgi:hypothetical protein
MSYELNKLFNSKLKIHPFKTFNSAPPHSRTQNRKLKDHDTRSQREN